MLNIVLHEPEIPQNTGNIARTCAATGATLHIIKPIPFEITESRAKRAGLDYWPFVNIVMYENTEEFFSKNPGVTIWMASTKAKQSIYDVKFNDGDFLMFGKETKGLPEDMIFGDLDHAIRIPMRDNIRSLNLSNSVAIVLYEAIRQCGLTL